MAFVPWRCSRQQQHQIGVLDARNENLAAVDNVLVALASRECLDAGGVAPGNRFRHREGLQPYRPLGDGGQKSSLLLLRTMPKQRTHDVHLGVCWTRVAALLIDLLQDGCRLLETETKPPEGLRNQRRQPAFFREGLHKRLRVLPPRVELAPVRVGKASA